MMSHTHQKGNGRLQTMDTYPSPSPNEELPTKEAALTGILDAELAASAAATASHSAQWTRDRSSGISISPGGTRRKGKLAQTGKKKN